MAEKRIKESNVYKKDVLLKSAIDIHLEEHEYLFQKTVYSESGKVLSEIHYSSDGSVVQQYEYEYNDAGQLVSDIMKEDDGVIAEHKTFEYNEKGLVLKEFRHYADGSFDTVSYAYDGEGRLERKELTDPDGETESVENFVWEKDQLVQHTIRDAENDLLYERKQQFNEKGKPIEIIDFEGREGESSRKEISYFDSGNIRETYHWNGADELVEKAIMEENEAGLLTKVVEETRLKKNTTTFEYDQSGNIVAQFETDRSGNLVSEVHRIYNDTSQLTSSDVFIDGGGRGLSRNYHLRHEYIYFD